MEAKMNNFLASSYRILEIKEIIKKVRFFTELLFSYTVMSNKCHDSDSWVSIK